MSLKKTIIRNVAAGWFGKIVKIAAALVTIPVLISHFGLYEYGVWVAVGQGASLLMLLDFGIANSISRFVARNLSLEEHGENIAVFSTAMAMFIVAAVLVSVVTMAVAPFVPGWFDIDAAHERDAFWIFVLTGINAALLFPLRVGRGLLQAVDRYDVIAFFQAAYSVLWLAAVLSIFGRGIGDLLLLAVVNLGLHLLIELALLIIALKAHSGLSFRFGRIAKKNFRELTSLGASAMVQTFSGAIMKKGPIVAIGVALGVETAPLFSIPKSMLQQAGPFIHRLGATFTPIASRMDATGQDEKLANLGVLGVRYGLAMSVPLCVYLMFFGRDLLTVWLGFSVFSADDFTRMTWILWIITIPYTVGSPQVATRSILRATGRHWLAAGGLLLTSVIGVATGILLMTRTNLGVDGAAVGWGMRFVLCEILLFNAAVCRCLGVDWRRYFKEVYVQPLKCAVVLVGLAAVLDAVFVIGNPWRIIGASLLFGAVGLFVSFRLVILDEHKKYIVDGVRRKMSRFGFAA